MIALLVYKDKTYKSLDSKNNNFKLAMDFMQNAEFHMGKELDFVYVINGSALPDKVPELIEHLSGSDNRVHDQKEIDKATDQPLPQEEQPKKKSPYAG